MGEHEVRPIDTQQREKGSGINRTSLADIQEFREAVD